MLTAPNLRAFEWLTHGFGWRDSVYPPGINTVKQIHSAIVLEAPGDREGDALVSREPGRIVGIRTADCVPVLIACPRTHSVAAIHAGWRGTGQNIVGAAVGELIARYGARAEDLHAAIGPAIGPCCYEVSPDVSRHFGAWVPESTHLDLPAINEAQLRAVGVRNTWQAGECTFCHAERYFSFRREKEQAGRMLSFIGVIDKSSP
ncbi:MAG: peptidoglycan editing factor PgeF [Acidobacteriota bacterium]|nr:peptidoglycan editing factor PgeF [Acidobacteriota bacterium]